MKPIFQPIGHGKHRFPLTDYCFHSGAGDWHGYPLHDDEFRDFYNLSRECLAISARERAKEMAVFAVVVLAAAWPVIYMVVTVARLLIKGRPLA
jgi:hypothetical protein